MLFPEKYYNLSNQKRLEETGDNNFLTKSWILGKKRNPYYVDDDSKYVTKRNTEYYALVDWILPSLNYKYKLLEREEYENLLRSEKKGDKKIVRASFIPVVRMNGENYWLLGSFHDYEDTNMPILADFGGKCEKRDGNFLDCAKRELKEESKRLLHKLVEEKLKDYYNLAVFEGTSHFNKVIFIVVPLEYEDIKNINTQFKILPRGREKLGAPNLYRQRDIRLRKYRTSKNLTDFISFLNKYKF